MLVDQIKPCMGAPILEVNGRWVHPYTVRWIHPSSKILAWTHPLWCMWLHPEDTHGCTHIMRVQPHGYTHIVWIHPHNIIYTDGYTHLTVGTPIYFISNSGCIHPQWVYPLMVFSWCGCTHRHIFPTNLGASAAVFGSRCGCTHRDGYTHHFVWFLTWLHPFTQWVHPPFVWFLNGCTHSIPNFIYLSSYSFQKIITLVYLPESQSITSFSAHFLIFNF